MNKFKLSYVLEFIPSTLAYLFYGFIGGAIFGFSLFYIDKSLYQAILQTWFKRILFGAALLQKNYILWFIANNLIALVFAIVGFVLLLILISRRRRFTSNRFVAFERHHPKITLASLYMIPIGALFINSFLISVLLTYVYLTEGFQKLMLIFAAIFPNGINEILALILASSLALSYLKIMKPLILKNKMKEAIKLSKQLIFSKTSLYIFIFIVILIVFAAYLEGSAISLLTK
jgi:hypothetical protein